jgi:hypothetical protein
VAHPRELNDVTRPPCWHQRNDRPNHLVASRRNAARMGQLFRGNSRLKATSHSLLAMRQEIWTKDETNYHIHIACQTKPSVFSRAIVVPKLRKKVSYLGGINRFIVFLLPLGAIPCQHSPDLLSRP